MIKNIVKDPLRLAVKSIKADENDLSVAYDLRDTLQAHIHECVGMAANMIGVNKNIIAISVGPSIMIMFNPVITKKKDAYMASEGCLSLSGVKETTRYKEIEVSYQDMGFNHKTQKFNGYIAEIIQHECDHLQGIII